MKHTIFRATVAVIAIVMMVGMVSCGDFSYIEDDIGPYVTFDKAAFDAIGITVPTSLEVTEEEINEVIRQNLFAKKTTVNNGAVETSGVMGDGDSVRLWYFGTVETEEGKTESIRDTASDKTYSNAPLWSVLGSGSLRIEALETELKGKDIKDYLATTKGTVKSGGIYYLSYYYNDINAEGNSVGGVRFDGVHRVPAAEMETVFGAGFSAAFEEAVVGQSYDVDSGKFFQVTVDGSYPNGGVKRVYQVRVCGQCERDLEVEGTFKNDGGAHAGKKVKLYVPLFGFIDYSVPELTAETVISLFKIDESSEDPVAEFRRQIKESLEAESTRQETIQDAIWDELKKCVTVHELPKSKVKEMYKVFLTTVKNYYKEAKSDDLREQFVAAYGEAAMQNLDTFAIAMLKGQSGQKAEDIVMEKAEDWVREDMIVFAIVKYGGLELSSEAKINEKVDSDLASIIEETGNTKEQLYEMYGGREYFIASAYRTEILSILSDTVQIKYEDTTI